MELALSKEEKNKENVEKEVAMVKKLLNEANENISKLQNKNEALVFEASPMDIGSPWSVS